MKRQSPLSLGIIYASLGILFTAIAVQTVTSSGWGIFAYILSHYCHYRFWFWNTDDSPAF